MGAGKSDAIDSAQVQVEAAPGKAGDAEAANGSPAGQHANGTDPPGLTPTKSQQNVLDNANIVGPYSLRVAKKPDAPAEEEVATVKVLTPRDRTPTQPDLADVYEPQPVTTRFASAVADGADEFCPSPPANTRFVGARADSADHCEPGSASPRDPSHKEAREVNISPRTSAAHPPRPQTQPSVARMRSRTPPPSAAPAPHPPAPSRPTNTVLVAQHWLGSSPPAARS